MYVSPDKTIPIARENVAGALDKSYERRKNSYKPSGVLKAVFHGRIDAYLPANTRYEGPEC